VEYRSFIIVIAVSISVVLELASKLVRIEHTGKDGISSVEFIVDHVKNYFG
jgi:hypothetical protein